MGNGLAGRTDAGTSATAEWRRARASSRRRRPLSRALATVAGALLLVAALAGPVWLAVGAAVAGWVAWRVRPDPDPERWLRGADGEVATAALLAQLPRRWVVLHDCAIPGSRANIDHLVIGPTGVWVVDTKTARAPLRLRRRAVSAGDRPILTEPAAWEAEVVSDRLGMEAAAIVAVHGEGLRRRGKVSGGIRVVPADRLVRRIRRGRRILSRADVAALARTAAEVLPPR